MKNVFAFWFGDDEIKKDFKILCSNNFMSIQDRLLFLVKEDLKREYIRQNLKVEYLNKRMDPGEFFSKLKLVNGEFLLPELNNIYKKIFKGENIQPENLNAPETI